MSQPLVPRSPSRTLALTGALALTALTLLSGCSAPPEETATTEPQATAAPDLTFELPAAADDAALQIDAAFLEEHIRALSDDRFEGRGPGTPGDEASRQYVIDQLQAMGLEPAGENGGWQQVFPIVGTDATVPETWSFEHAGKSLDLDFMEDFIAASGVQSERAAVEDAEVVFVGYGIEAPEHDWDDFKGADLRGKVLLMLNNDPDWDAELFEGNRRLYYGRWTYKYESAARQGAAGAIIIHTDASAGYPWQVVQSSWTGPQFELPATDEPRIDIAAWTSWEASQELVQLAGRDLDELTESARSRDFQPVPLGIRTSLALQNRVSQDTTTANVLGRIPGRDAGLAEQAVIYTAHLDHLGRGNPDDSGDEIYNGARDNASGTAMLMAIAKAYQALPEAPRRSILFAFVGAEEQGLLGSKYFAQQPTVPAGHLVANINFDSGNIFGPTRDLSYIGYGKSNLDEIAVAAAAKQDREVKGDQYPDRGLFYRSDQFSLAKIGVPAMYLSSGTDFIGGDEIKERAAAWVTNNYHQQSDEVEDFWNFEGMVQDAKIGFWAGLAIANSDGLPAWNEGDEFEAARLEALAAVN